MHYIRTHNPAELLLLLQPLHLLISINRELSLLSTYLPFSPPLSRILQAASSSWKLHLATSYVLLLLLLLAFVKCQRIVGIISGHALCSVSSFHANFQIFLHFNYQHQHQARNLHPQCSCAWPPGWLEGGTRQRAVVCFVSWLAKLIALVVCCRCCAKGSRISSTDADDDPICLSNDATCCATVRATCNVPRATALSRYTKRLMPATAIDLVHLCYLQIVWHLCLIFGL